MSELSQLHQLVDRFARGHAAFTSGGYKETQLRIEFIDPMFRMLGWDMDNRSGLGEIYKEVIHEDAIRIEGKHKAPDYGFRIGGSRRFFVEAKQPSVNIHLNAEPAIQLRRYGWSANLPVSILTDFEELAIYDCRVRPDKGDTAAVARLEIHSFDQYPEKWDRIYSLFSKEAVLAGALDTFAGSMDSRRGTATVDAAFLGEIERWRLTLARNITLRNPGLNTHQLNFAVQMTIDRIIFLRMVEDRGIEEYGQLRRISAGKDTYAKLLHVFRRADDRYNSGLFHFSKEKSRPADFDDLSPTLRVDDEPLNGIIDGLYFPQCPYEFSVLPPDVLGQVYEQFLGKVIQKDELGAISVVEKPEVKKAGGVYYTPSDVVEHIVFSTLTPILEGKRPGPRGGLSKVRIVDPACGSGSFLIRAYQFLLDWHLREYLKDSPDRHRDILYERATGDWRLTTQERKRILLNNIFGVDIDPQAVEVTKLSLLLKVLEGESEETLVRQLKMFHERALPDLDSNIKCGNSLIGSDFYDHAQLSFLDLEAQILINTFDWEIAFPVVFADGGFDAVIGNPPYFNMDETWGRGDERQRYVKGHYSFVYNDKTDILFYFLAKAVQICKCEIGFIVSRAFLEAYKANKLRQWLAKNVSIRGLTDFQNYYVFAGVGISTAILQLTKEKLVSPAKVFKLRHSDFRLGRLNEQQRDSSGDFEYIPIPQSAFGEDSWTFASSSVLEITEKLDSCGTPLGEILYIGQGMQTGRNRVFTGLDSSTITRWGLSEDLFYCRAKNSDIRSFEIRSSGDNVLYLEDIGSFDELPAGAREHLLNHESELKQRAAFIRGNCEWWKFTWPLHKELRNVPRILCPYLATENRFATDQSAEFLGLTDTTVLYDRGQPESLAFLAGLLNSDLLSFRFRFIGKLKGSGIYEYFWNSISKLPIRRIDFQNSDQVSLYQQISSISQEIEQTCSTKQHCKTAIERTSVNQRLRTLSKFLNELVYELYEVTPTEANFIEDRLKQ